MSEVTLNKRGYTKQKPGEKPPTRSVEEINKSLTRRGRSPITQADLQAMNGPRSKSRREKATFFILENDKSLAVRIGREEGTALVEAGKAVPVKRRDLKDGKVPTKDSVYAPKTSNNEKKRNNRKKGRKSA